MTLAVQTGRTLYTGNGILTSFAIVFEYYNDNNNIDVYIRDNAVSPYTETIQVYGVDYTISGGNVVMTSAPSATKQLLIIRNMDLTQVKDFQNNSAFIPSEAEDGLDRIDAQLQQVNEMALRAIKIRKTSSLSNLDIEDPVANQVLVWNGSANRITSTPAASLSSAVNYAQEVPVGAINNSNVSFSISNTPTANSFKLYKNGLRLRVGTDYSFVGTTITMVIAPNFGEFLDCDYSY